MFLLRPTPLPLSFLLSLSSRALSSLSPASTHTPPFHHYPLTPCPSLPLIRSPPTPCRWHGKQVPKKPDTKSVYYAVSHFNWASPLTEEELSSLPDIRNMSNQEWICSERHLDQQFMACFHQIYPDAFDSPILPDVNFLVQFRNRELVYRGNWIAPDLTFDPPKVAFEPVGTEVTDKWNTFWTVIMLDLDDPNRDQPEGRSKAHWLVTNIPAKGQIEDGVTLVDYIPPTPYKNSGAHRYLLALCRQEKGQVDWADHPRVPKTEWNGSRVNFRLMDFVTKNQMVIHGYSFFQSEWNESVTRYFQDFLKIQEPEWETNEEAERRRVERERDIRRKKRELERAMGIKMEK